MIFSYLRIAFDIPPNNILIYEDDSSLEINEIEDRILTLREEALKNAIGLKDIHNLFRRGT